MHGGGSTPSTLSLAKESLCLVSLAGFPQLAGLGAFQNPPHFAESRSWRGDRRLDLSPNLLAVLGRMPETPESHPTVQWVSFRK